MSWAVVARKDFEDAIRAKTLWVLVALFSLLIAVSTWYFGEVQASGNGGLPGQELIISLLLPTSILLPAIGIMVGYKAIVGERDSGSIKVLLSLPHTRRDVLVGKFVGRAAVVSAAVVLGFLIGAVVFAVFAESFALLEYVQFLALTIVLGAVFVGIAVGFSASTRSGTIAIAVGIALVLLFTILWNILTRLLVFVLNELLNLAPGTLIDIRGLMNSINPTNAYYRLMVTLFDGSGGGGGPFGGNGFYTEPWFAVAVLAFWLIGPLLVGYWRFESAEL